MVVSCASARPAASTEQNPLLNRPAPAFTRPGLDHRPISLAGYRGHVVLLNFWATWCGPCKVEIPRFMEWQQHYGPQGLQVLGVSIDDDQPPVDAYVRKAKLNYPVMMGDAKLGTLYGGVLGVPVTLLIDRKGIVRARFDGETELNAMEAKVKELLR
jgi:thiol-disulfide isomerase/thioredoxin